MKALQHGQSEERVCGYEECGKSFVATHETWAQRYCSDDCKEKARCLRRRQATARKLASMEPIPCGYKPCSKMFRPKRWGNKYCCPEHQLLHNNERRSRGTGIKRVRKTGKPKAKTGKVQTGKLIDTTPLSPELIAKLEGRHDITAAPMVLVETSDEVQAILDRMSKARGAAPPWLEWTRNSRNGMRDGGNG